MSLTIISKNCFSDINFFQPQLSLQKPLKNNPKLFDSGKETSHHLLGNREILLIQNFNKQSQKEAHFKSLLHRLENPNKSSITIEEIEHFLDDIEQGRFEQSASEEDLFRATTLLIDYAKRGTQNTQDQKNLEADIEQLFSYQGEDVFFDSFDSISSQDLQRKLFTKKYGKGKDFFKNIGNFIKKHRKAIIITAVAVVAAAIAITAAVVIIKAAGTAAIAEGAAASGAGLAGVIGAAQTIDDNPQEEETVEPPSSKINPEPVVSILTTNTSKLTDPIEQSVAQNTINNPKDPFEAFPFTSTTKAPEPELFSFQRLSRDKTVSNEPFADLNNIKEITWSEENITMLREERAKIKEQIEKVRAAYADYQKKLKESIVTISEEIKDSGKDFLQTVSTKIHQVTEPSQFWLSTSGQDSNTIATPAPSSAYQVTAGITKSAIITNIEKAKQTIQSYGDQLVDTFKDNTTNLKSNWPQLIPVIGQVNTIFSNKENSRALLQNAAGNVHKIYELTHLPASDKPFFPDFDPFSISAFNNHMTDFGINPTLSAEKFMPYDPSLKARRNRIKDGRGYENDIATLAYCSIDSIDLLANLSGKNFVYPTQQSKMISLNRPEFKHARIYFTAGIDTTDDDLKKNITAVSDMTGGYNVRGTSKPTHGALADINKASKAVLDCIATEASYLLAQEIKDYLNEDPKNIVYLGGHSYGAAVNLNALALLPEDQLKRICVLGVAPAGYVVSEDLKAIKHLASKGDYVHCIDARGREAAMATTTYLEPHPDAPSHDHAFLSPTFKPKLDDYYKDIVQKSTTDE